MMHKEIMVAFSTKFFRVHSDETITEADAQEGFRAFDDYLKGYFDAAAIGWGNVFITPQIFSCHHKILYDQDIGEFGKGSGIEVDMILNFVLDYEKQEKEIPDTKVLTEMLDVASRSFILSRTKHQYIFIDEKVGS